MATSTRLFLAGASILLLLAVSGIAAAEPMYTIDAASDSLFIIESSTGRITQGVGPLGVDVYDCGSLCTTPTGLLYGVYTPSVFGARYFIEISRATGAVVRSIELDVWYAEGLADDPLTGQLYITYGYVRIPTLSDYIGTIDPATGVITPLGRLEFRPDDNEDGDEIRFSDAGQMYLVNSLCCGAGADVYQMHGLNGTLVGQTILPISDLNYIDFLTDGTLIGLDNADDVLMTISTVDGSVSGFVTCQRMSFTGLARVKGGPVTVVPKTWGAVKAAYR